MEEGVISYLLSDSTVQALVSNRVFPGSRPQGSQLPAITIYRISGAPIYADDGEAGLDESRVQIDCWGETYSEAKQTARAVRDRLSGFVGPSGGITFQYLLIDSERDLRESGSNSSEYLFRTSIDLIVWNE